MILIGIITACIKMEKAILTPKNLGQLVKESRIAQGLNQDDLAGLTGTGRRFISELENGKVTLQLGKALHVLGALGIAISATTKWEK